jgi:hypothetical protein
MSEHKDYDGRELHASHIGKNILDPGCAQGRLFVACDARRSRRSAALDERAVFAL